VFGTPELFFKSEQRLAFLCWPLLLFLSFSCRTDLEKPGSNRAPLVRLATEKINLPDSVRLFTRVHLFWSGQDADGFVKGYRTAWSNNRDKALANLNTAPLQARTDSTFLFNFAGSSDTSTIWFVVEAEDDKGLRSEEPAVLKIPLQNSAPSISFLADGLPQADSIWSVISLPYSFSDPDGADNIDSIYLRINEGTWTALPKNIGFISLVPEDPAAISETNALLFAGENLATLSKEPAPIAGIKVPGLRLNADNRFQLMIKDLANSRSKDSTRTYYIRRKTSDLLLLDAVKTSTRDSLYTGIIGSISPFDRLDLNFPEIPGTRVGANQPRFWNSSFYLLCSLYKKVFWYSDILPTNQPAGADTTRILLTPAAPSLNQYLRFNGKLLISSSFPDGKNQLPQDNAAFSVLPVSSFYQRSDTIRIKPNGLVLPRKPGYDSLKILNTGSIITGVDVFYPSPGADTLFVLPKSSLGGYPGINPLCISAKTQNPNTGRTNLVFFGMELYYLSANRQALRQTFYKILNEEFNW
jgi:hypothetical protein